MRKLKDKERIYGAGSNVFASKVKRQGNVAMYLRNDDYYEVFKVTSSPEKEIFGWVYPERENYPSNEDFSSTAWCIRDKELAEIKFNKLIQQELKKTTKQNDHGNTD